MLDPTDHQILAVLTKNARLQWREIGEQVHLTGQAVANRIRRLEALGVIKHYTVALDHQKLAKTVTAYVTVFMKTTDHASFHQFIGAQDVIIAADRISGEGCYLLKVVVASNDELNGFLNRLLQFGNYRVNLSIGTLK